MGWITEYIENNRNTTKYQYKYEDELCCCFWTNGNMQIEMNGKKQQNGRKKINDINQTSLTMHKKIHKFIWVDKFDVCNDFWHDLTNGREKNEYDNECRSVSVDGKCFEKCLNV